MRATQIRAGLVTKLTAIVPDHQASAQDVFRYVDEISEDPSGKYPDRHFWLVPSDPPSPDYGNLTGLSAMTADPYSVSFALLIMYRRSPGTTDRILADGEVVVDALRSYQTGGQIHTVEITPARVYDADDTILVGWEITVRYDRRDP